MPLFSVLKTRKKSRMAMALFYDRVTVICVSTWKTLAFAHRALFIRSAILNTLGTVEMYVRVSFSNVKRESRFATTAFTQAGKLFLTGPHLFENQTIYRRRSFFRHNPQPPLPSMLPPLSIFSRRVGILAMQRCTPIRYFL